MYRRGNSLISQNILNSRNSEILKFYKGGVILFFRLSPGQSVEVLGARNAGEGWKEENGPKRKKS